ncbi:MAG TPA: hypothetical protein VGQ41_01460 [Pyrinomonadaceae bacterium]|jgi:hypothetical protein|nr:hypothetical protein [Pyrinomonadaceae bacterium]
MKKQISSDATSLWKYIFPGFWIPLMGIGAIVWLFHISEEPAAAVVFFAMWLGFSSFLIWFARRLKVVSIDERTLFVSVGRREIEIPFSNVETVKQSFWTNPKLITLTLKHPAEFGEKVVFVPTPQLFGAVRSHPIVEQIRALINESRASATQR